MLIESKLWGQCTLSFLHVHVQTSKIPQADNMYKSQPILTGKAEELLQSCV